MNFSKFDRSGAYLAVRNFRETFDYYRDNPGFSEEWNIAEKDGGIRRDDLPLLFSEDPAHTATLNNETNRLNLMRFVDNIETIFPEFKKEELKS